MAAHTLQPSARLWVCNKFSGCVVILPDWSLRHVISLWWEQLDSRKNAALSRQGPSSVTSTPSGKQEFSSSAIAMFSNGESKEKRWYLEMMWARAWHDIAEEEWRTGPERVDVILSLAVRCLACKGWGRKRAREAMWDKALNISPLTLLFFSPP